MFDFAISGNTNRRSAKRVVASLMTSCCGHLLVLFLLIEYPLQGPGIWRLSPVQKPQPNDDIRNWRLVTNLPMKMTMPSSEIPKKLPSDSGKKGSGTKPGHIPLNDVTVVVSNQPSNPKAPPEVKNPSTSPPDIEITPPVAVSPKPETRNPGPLAGNQNNGDAGKEGPLNLPPPEPESKPAVAEIVPPNKIIDPIRRPPDIPAVPPKNPPASEEQIRASVSITGDNSKGFGMGEYINRIKELIVDKWEIPSYLKDSQGHTTVGFYIDKDGHTMKVRVLTGSGSEPLDKAALSAVLWCNLPALPKGFAGDHIDVQFEFFYNK